MRDIIEYQGNSMDFSSFRLHKNGLEPIGNPSFDDWLKCGQFLKSTNGAVHFWIGDWLNYGEKTYGETYAQAMDETGYNYQTLSNDKWVARKIEISRRRENLSFRHHQEVADLEPEEQEEMLKKAETDKLPSNEFRKIVRDYKLRLDLPEFTEEELKPSVADFDTITPIVMELVDVTDKIKEINMDKINPDARDFLISQLKKSAGLMGGIVIKYGK